MSARRTRRIKNRRKQNEQRKQTVKIVLVGVSLVALGLYMRWNSNQVAEPLASDQTIVQGEQVYSQNCAACHGEQGEGHAAVVQAPAVNGDEHAWHHADGQLQELILNGGIDMPSFQNELTDQDVIAVIRYIQTLWRPDQLKAQQSISEQNPLR